MAVIRRMSKSQKDVAVKKFVEKWMAKEGHESEEAHFFWIDLLHNVLGVEDVDTYIQFEKQVRAPILSGHSYADHIVTDKIDGYILSTRVLIENKSATINLNEPEHKTKRIRDQVISYDETPLEQAKKYAFNLPFSERPRWIILCNFREFQIHDLQEPNNAPVCFRLDEMLGKIHLLDILLDSDSIISPELDPSFKAGTLIGKLYDDIRPMYINPDSAESLNYLNILCVRVVFCLYAEDSDLFPGHLMFNKYLRRFNPDNVHLALKRLFYEVLNTPPAERDIYLEESLKSFPYVNGGLFEDTSAVIPPLTDAIVMFLLRDVSEKFNWSKISPTIFGALFESTLNPETRSSNGMHYTSVENIHKVIDPLFLNDLKTELMDIMKLPDGRTRVRKLEAYRDKLGSLKFLDPACGSGNFLTETYISLRKLENDALSLIYGGKSKIELGSEVGNIIKVKINQFYGFEINSFAVTVAKTALWIAESQMLRETESILKTDIDFLPIRSYANIIESNALRMNWEDVVPKNELNYIIGNPPFQGARIMSPQQKDDVAYVFGDDWKNVGNLDYVSCWFKKCSDIMTETNIRSALVATNSICQGENVANLWKTLFEDGVHIDYAYRSFQWDSEAKIKAHVFCVIVGFSKTVKSQDKYIFTADEKIKARNINGYLNDAKNFYVESRSTPICRVPSIGIGNKPIDDGNYLFTKEEMEDFIRREPESRRYFRPWYGSEEFIRCKPRYCLWLGDCTPSEINSMPHCKALVTNVRNFRLSRDSAPTRKLADKPTRFHVENMPSSSYIVVPKVSTKSRQYIPIGFMSPDVLCSDLVFIIPDVNLYHFGVLTSSVHMSWMRAVCGRLGEGYRYSKDVVYNNFPWPKANSNKIEKIKQTAQGILDARNNYADSSFMDLYDDSLMPNTLREAHKKNDDAVKEAYGFSNDISEEEIVSSLFKLHDKLLRK